MNSLKGVSGRDYSYSVEDHLLFAGDVSYEFDADGFLAKETQGADVTNYNYSFRGELLNTRKVKHEEVEIMVVKKETRTVVYHESLLHDGKVHGRYEFLHGILSRYLTFF